MSAFVKVEDVHSFARDVHICVHVRWCLGDRQLSGTTLPGSICEPLTEAQVKTSEPKWSQEPSFRWLTRTSRTSIQETPSHPGLVPDIRGDFQPGPDAMGEAVLDTTEVDMDFLEVWKPR